MYQENYLVFIGGGGIRDYLLALKPIALTLHVRKCDAPQE